MTDLITKKLSQGEAYRVAAWLREKGKYVDAVLVNIWKKRPSEIASEYSVKENDVLEAAGREIIKER